jgi:TonB family protein
MFKRGSDFMPQKVAVLCLLSFACVSIAGAQSPAGAHNAETPAEAFNVARQQSDIRQPGARPFKLVARFKATDEKGAQTSGQYTEIWISPEKWRREVRNDSFREREGCGLGQFYRTATGETVPDDIASVIDNITPTLPKVSAEELNRDWSIKPAAVATTPMMQVAHVMKFEDRGAFADAAYFFAPEEGYLRGSETFIETVAYNNLRKGLGRVVPYTITSSHPHSKRTLSITVTWFGPPGEVQDYMFASPSDSNGKCIDTRRELKSDVIAGSLLKKVEPVYPDTARRAGTSGNVVLHVTIDRSGRVTAVRLVSARRADLATSAMLAVKHYVYKPFLVDGSPTEVEGTVTVNFVAHK